MTVVLCVAVTNSLTSLMRQGDVAVRLRRLRSRSAAPAEYVAALAELADPSVAELVETQFGELPTTTLMTIVDSWAMADEAGKDFTLETVAPDGLLAFARARRVRVSVDVEEAGVRVSISHVAGRHAGWYAPAALTA